MFDSDEHIKPNILKLQKKKNELIKKKRIKIEIVERIDRDERSLLRFAEASSATSSEVSNANGARPRNQRTLERSHQFN